jgi:hypothetical protein
MQTNTIKGELNLALKKISFTEITPIVTAENRTTLIKVILPLELQAFDIYFLFKEYSGNTIITPKLEVKSETVDVDKTVYYVEYLLVNSALAKTGMVAFQLLGNKTDGSYTHTYKSLINQQLTVSQSLSEDVLREETPDIIAVVQTAINDANSAAAYTAGIGEQLLTDKAMGIFNGEDGRDGADGEKGDKGDASTIDKIGTPTDIIDLTDIEKGVFGTINNPFVIAENTTISFANLSLADGYQKSFILYIKRTADVSITWQNITKWAYDEIPILTVNKVQKILIETSDGTNYYGTQGDYFNV